MINEHQDKIGKQVGNYRLLRLLGQGGFAEVYLGEHIYLSTQAAIKILHTYLDQEGVELFRKEAQIIAHLVHPHIVRVLDFDVEEGVPFLVMDYARNGTLRQRYPKGSIVPPQSVISYTQQIASALQYAHDHRLVHRDIKPENILLDQNDQILLSDFGIALLQSSLSQSTDKAVTGTMAYMAPEQIQGKPRPASDQYALAAVVYEWISGERPFTGSYIEIMTQHLTTEPPALAARGIAAPEAVEKVLDKALAKDPAQRFARVQDFADALSKAYGGSDPTLVLASRKRTTPQTPSQPQPTIRAESIIPPKQTSFVQEDVEVLHTPSTRQMPFHTEPVVHSPPFTSPPPAFQPPIEPTRRAERTPRTFFATLQRTVVLIGGLILLGIVALCGGGYAIVHSLTASNTTLVDANGAVTKANDFLSNLEQQNYNRAYTALNTSKLQESMNDFRNKATGEDRCYGSISGYTRDTNAPGSSNNSLKYTYHLTRSKMTKPYDLYLTLQPDSNGNWQIVAYDSNVDSVQKSCSP